MLAICLSIIETQEEKDTFEELYHKYRKVIYGISCEYLGKLGLVDDAAQETFLKLTKYLKQIEQMDEHKVFNFIRIVTKCVCLDILKKEKSQQLKQEKLSKTITFDEDNEEFDIVWERIMAMPEIYRNTLMLKYYYGLSEKEICHITNITKSAFYKRLQRAKALLKGNEI